MITAHGDPLTLPVAVSLEPLYSHSIVYIDLIIANSGTTEFMEAVENHYMEE